MNISLPSPVNARVALETAALSIGVTAFFVFVVRRLAITGGFVSSPRPDRWAALKPPKALFGGIAMLLGFWFGLAPSVSEHFSLAWQILLAGNLAFAVVGFVDDWVEFRPATKVLWQLVAALPPVWLGLRLPGVNSVVGQILALAWILVVVNAVNLLDNMDGLAAGVVLIASAALAFHAAENQNGPGLASAVALGGCCIGFLFFNFPPSSIFMGDTGSHFIGYTLAVLTLLNAANARTTVASAIVGPALVLLVPIFDTTLVAVNRFVSGRSVTAGAADHSSHRLVTLGLSERRTAVLIYVLAAAGGIASIVVSRVSLAWIVVLLLAILTSIYYFGTFLSRVPVYARGTKAIDAAERSRMAVFNTFIPYKWGLLDLVADTGIVIAAHVASYLLRFEGRLDDDTMALLSRSLPVMIGCRLVCFQVFGIYRRIPGHFSMFDVLSIAKAVLASTTAGVTILVIAFRFYSFSRAAVVIDAALTFGIVVAGHASLAVFSELLRGRQSRDGTIRTLIIGAGNLGAAATRLFRADRKVPRSVVAFLDDDEVKIGKRLHGVLIRGPISDLEKVLGTDQVDEVFVACSWLSDEKSRLVDQACDNHGVVVRRFRID